MADGNGKTNDYRASAAEQVAGIAQTFPYVPPIPRQVFVPPNGGACDPLLREIPQRLLPQRYATAFFRFVNDGGDLSLDAEAEPVILFANGYGNGSSASGADGTQTQLDTNAPKQGGAVQQRQLFVTVGLGVSFGMPFAIASTDEAVDINAPRAYPSWLRQEYALPCIQGVSDVVWMELQHQEEACKYGLGPIAMLPAISNTLGQDKAQTQPIAGQFLYLSIPDVSTSASDQAAMQLNLYKQRQAIVGANASLPVGTGLDVVVPLRVALVGVPICDTAAGPSEGMEERIARRVANIMREQG